ncbi:hypothetical protein PoB_005191000 [Plakobranchus ocellatus]|uniref:Uncharacterized protein n=1 Tax=Plakobranchus ocellatus TaxID=259542 RepID=A0AAV4BYB1_9GAST|nr:hypothetical protein PoB_005191000 [Plakobranchus ocellatus]
MGVAILEPVVFNSAFINGAETEHRESEFVVLVFPVYRIKNYGLVQELCPFSCFFSDVPRTSTYRLHSLLLDVDGNGFRTVFNGLLELAIDTLCTSRDEFADHCAINASEQR